MLKIENMYVNYGAIKAIRGINIQVKEGSIVTLIGANGAGKTTTLRTISGLIKPASGKVIYCNEDITNLSADKIVQRGISQSPEGRLIFSNLTVLENLEMGAYTRKDKYKLKDDLEFIFHFFPRLKERLKQYGGTLSGGEQQMLAISRALMSKPKLLLLDEPSLGIAPLLVKTIFEQIVKLNRETGITVLIVEQNAYLALQNSNYGYVLETGELIIEGDAKELIQNEEVKKAYLGG
ncbi:MAG: ABC transporter ATP-binding protein [Ignavibacteriaceae bacterium]|nr:MAG: ABC transporter ATP-binding protein [Chlorobiota bacterium]KXK02438.1 MAG: ABC transporter, ATP-binding protein [Chlorobi bacterium OLB4]MBV6398034.1 High-affinity branched-chain amino acid transport ATP-binding protein LivF [Ignavibacteria bacterium]MCC6886482.1 ABC transporter ATP-binding protein [Ignavibacteriales bacterium]MCE7952442.1 ABC transporter ATP-binding protein [Chlorobi bacterium CHB7]MDL1886559.1 ABC transporter ATP-binding protein [Ignavibacteria bacterium CHB1]MEB232